MKEIIIIIFSKVNSIFSSITTLFIAIFGGQWGLFAAYLLLNIVDYITGIIKAKKTKKENSTSGMKGIIKKVCYWIIIMTAFSISYILVEICNKFSINIEFIMLFAWFTLACLAINEARSIIENLIEIGVNIPEFLVKGLEITKQKMENIVEEKIEDNKVNLKK